MDLPGFPKGKDGQRPDKSVGNIPSSIPALQHAMSAATKGATDAFSNVGRHVNDSIRRLGGKSIEAGGGHGIGFGHGFGVGLSAKPGGTHRLQTCFRVAMIKMMMKLGILPSFPIDQIMIPGSLQTVMRSISVASDSNVQSSVGNIMQLVTKTTKATSNSNVQSSVGNIMELVTKTTEPASNSNVQSSVGNIMDLVAKTKETMSHGPSKDGDSHVESKHETSALKGTPSEVFVGSHSERVIRNFLQSPILKNEETKLNEMAAKLRSENNMLQMLLKHQQVIEELKEENKKLHRILVEDLKVPPSKLEASNESKIKSNDPPN